MRRATPSPRLTTSRGGGRAQRQRRRGGLPRPTANLEDPLAAADLAHLSRQVRGRRHICLFEPEMDERMQRRRELERDMGEALDAANFRCTTNRSAARRRNHCFEALLRWPSRPADRLAGHFIPLAEDSGLIAEIGELALEAPPRGGLLAGPDVKSQSICRRGSSRRTVSPIRPALRGIRPVGPSPRTRDHRGVMLVDFRGERDAAPVQAWGFLAIDDFGAGYSLAYLQSFPFDKIKIDRPSSPICRRSRLASRSCAPSPTLRAPCV